MNRAKIRIKLIARGQDGHAWRAQLPDALRHPARSSDCEFIWDKAAEHYDWLVVIDDVSRGLSDPPERLACADEHTLLVTTEPPTITHYGRAFCAQFAQVLTSQPPEALPHTRRIYSHTGNLWFNGHSFDDLAGHAFPAKTRSIATVCSSKQQKHTLHNERFQFSRWLQQQLPELEIYGHGSRFIPKKYDALDPFRFHLAIENYVGPHHWTEKLADPFLSGAFPIYYGCPNLSDYFPQDSFLQIDIFDRYAALENIRRLIEDESFYTSRIDALYEARRRVMEDYNLLTMIEEIVTDTNSPSPKPSQRPLYGRKQMRFKKPLELYRHVKWHCSK